MKQIEMFIEGVLDIKPFVEQMRIDPELQACIRALIPSEAQNNPEHDYWKRYSYYALKQFDFDVYELIMHRNKFDGSMGDNLNLFSEIATPYCFFHPEIIGTTKYADLFDFYLDVISDCYDGLEVRHITERIIQETLEIPVKTTRIKKAKEQIKHVFHVTGNQRPYWHQGPEWPMGKCSPMKYVSRKRKKDSVIYLFEDVDTKETRTVVQYD